MGDSIPDRDLLRRWASRRFRRLAYVVLALGVLMVAALVASFALGYARPYLLLPFAALGVTAAVTQRQMTRAFHLGHAEHPRIDALTRDLAERTLLRPWVAWLSALTAAWVSFGLNRNRSRRYLEVQS